MGRNSVVCDRALAVDRQAERVDDAADQRLADRHLGDAAGALDRVAFLDARVSSPRSTAPTWSCSRLSTMPTTSPGNCEQLAGHRLLEPVDARDAVADLDDAADLLEVDLRLVARELALDDLADLSGLDHACLPYPRASRSPHPRRADRRGCRPRSRLPISATKPPSSCWSTTSSRTTCLPPSARARAGARQRRALRRRSAAPRSARARARGPRVGVEQRRDTRRRSRRDGRRARARRPAPGSRAASLRELAGACATSAGDLLA